MNEMKPMSEAPKDGTRILVYGEALYDGGAFSVPDHYKFCIVYWSLDGYLVGDDGGWASEQGNIQQVYDNCVGWWPLPEVPKEATHDIDETG